MKKVLEQLNIEDIDVNKEVENIVKETQDKTAIGSKDNLKPIKEAFTIMEWLLRQVSRSLVFATPR